MHDYYLTVVVRVHLRWLRQKYVISASESVLACDIIEGLNNYMCLDGCLESKSFPFSFPRSVALVVARIFAPQKLGKENIMRGVLVFFFPVMHGIPDKDLAY